MTTWAVIAIIVAIAALFAIRVARRTSRRCPEGKGLYPECLYVVTVTGDEVRLVRPDKTTISVPVRELREVVVETNDSGPLCADVWYHLRTAVPEVSCSFPGGSTGESGVIEFLEKLPGYSDVALREAMGCTSNRQFVVWRSAV